MKPKKQVSNIVLIGLVSLFVDMSTEMVYPVLPLFLTATLGASPAIVGIIEGIAESLSSLLKVFSGYIGDAYHKKKPLALIGYSASVVYKILLLLAGSWAGVLVARIVDRTGKGIRTAPRDALVAQSSDRKKLGGSFGFHKMMDMAGSAAGALLAFYFVSAKLPYRSIFLWSIVPCVIGILIIPMIREKKDACPACDKLSFRGLKLEPRIKMYFAVMFLFCLGNSSNVFLLLKAKDRGFTSAQVMLLYLIFNLAASLLSIPSGKFSDKFGRKPVLVSGYLIYGLVYIGFALFVSQVSVILLFISYGAYTAFISGAERAFVSEASPVRYKGTVLGIYGMLQGIGLFFSSMIAGALWDRIDSNAPFWFGGILGIFCALFVLIILSTDKWKKHDVKTV